MKADRSIVSPSSSLLLMAEADSDRLKELCAVRRAEKSESASVGAWVCKPLLKAVAFGGGVSAVFGFFCGVEVGVVAAEAAACSSW